jgi:pimeloyl-ACP methyl ester carboxylesterase
MADIHMIETTVGPLAVRVLGEGPTAVLWPSLFMDGRSWDRVIPALAPGRRLVVIDPPGHGSSGDPGRSYTMRECASAAGQVLDRLAVDDPVDWVGNAWGGHVGALFAVTQPGQCRSLVMLGSPVAALTGAERRRTYPLLIAHGVLGPVELVLSGVTEVLLSAHTRSNNPDTVAFVRDCLRRADRRMLRNAVVSISLRREAMTDLLPQIAAPALVVTGADHTGFTPSQAEAAASLFPNARSTVVPDAAYLVPLEAPTATSRLILDHWAQCDEGVLGSIASEDPAVHEAFPAHDPSDGRP